MFTWFDVDSLFIPLTQLFAVPSIKGKLGGLTIKIQSLLCKKSHYASLPMSCTDVKSFTIFLNVAPFIYLFIYFYKHCLPIC